MIFSRFILSSLLFFIGGKTVAQATNGHTRSNVLWIYLEDVNGWFSCYGETLIETPNIDALAESGTRFTRFYTPAGICSATRSALITGMMQTSIGAHNHHSCRPEKWGHSFRTKYDKNVLPDYAKPLPIRFREAGYWTFNDGSKNDFNFDWDGEELFDFNEGGLWDWGSVPWGPRRLLAGQCLDGKPDDQPFFGQIQLGGGKNKRVSPEVVDPAKVTVPPYCPDIPEIRENIARHYDCLLQTDKEVGQIIAYLKEHELYENTLIILFSDHGMSLPRHKEQLYEGAIHMPLVVSGPGIEAEAVRDDLISGIDISAATLAAAGIEVPDTMEGRNFIAENYQPRTHVIAARDRVVYAVDRVRAVVTARFKYLRNFMTDRTYMQPHYDDKTPLTKKFRTMMANGEMKGHLSLFFGDTRAPEEFYDLKNDPFELYNLAGNPAFADDLADHRKLLADWIEDTGDQGQYSESDVGLLNELSVWPDVNVSPEFERVRPMLADHKPVILKKNQK
ncbi:sulfatase [Opitutales bacterium]|nr:sulfatase [Opitutales bacterium]